MKTLKKKILKKILSNISWDSSCCLWAVSFFQIPEVYIYKVKANKRCLKIKIKILRRQFLLHIFDFHWWVTPSPLVCEYNAREVIVMVVRKILDKFCGISFNRMSGHFVWYDGVSSAKFSIPGVLHIGLGNSFLGSLTWWWSHDFLADVF